MEAVKRNSKSIINDVNGFHMLSSLLFPKSKVPAPKKKPKWKTFDSRHAWIKVGGDAEAGEGEERSPSY